MFKKRGHRNSILNKKQKNIIRVVYREISYERKNRMYTPSMFILKYFVEAEFRKFPRVSIETYRSIVKNLDIYPQHKSSRRKVYRKKWEAPYVGMIMQGDTGIHMWIPEKSTM